MTHHALAPLQPTKGEKALVTIGFFLGMLFLSFALFFLLALIVYALWNHALVPGVTTLKPIGYLHAAGILLLVSILFGSYHMRPIVSCCERM